MAKVVASLLVAMAMALVVVDSVHAANPPQMPSDCTPYLLEEDSQPSKFCCIEVQDKFKIVKASASLKSWCNAVKGVKLFNGEGLPAHQLQLALGLPQKCNLSGQYKKGQTCAGKLMPGGS